MCRQPAGHSDVKEPSLILTEIKVYVTVVQYSGVCLLGSVYGVAIVQIIRFGLGGRDLQEDFRTLGKDDVDLESKKPLG
jgi:hypothetical protein